MCTHKSPACTLSSYGEESSCLAIFRGMAVFQFGGRLKKGRQWQGLLRFSKKLRKKLQFQMSDPLHLPMKIKREIKIFLFFNYSMRKNHGSCDKNLYIKNRWNHSKNMSSGPKNTTLLDPAIYQLPLCIQSLVLPEPNFPQL